MNSRACVAVAVLAVSLGAAAVWAQTPPGPVPVRESEIPFNILHDQKFFWLRPFRAQRQDAPAWAFLAVGTAALMPLDSPAARALAVEPPGDGFGFSRRVGQLSGVGVDLAVAGTFYLVGRVRHDHRARETGLLGAQALGNALIITEFLKLAAGRSRPTRREGMELVHDADGEFARGGRSFPSGHALQAWALATVVAEEYRHNPWVRYSAFGLAGFVSVARVTARKHFPSDVFVGSVLGYFIGRHVFRAYHCSACLDAGASGRLDDANFAAPAWSVGPYIGPGGRVGLMLSYELR